MTSNTAFPEEWRKIIGFKYEASDRGHIRRRPLNGAASPKFVPTSVDTNGNLIVVLTKGSKQSALYVDDLVCETFIGAPPDSDMYVEHIDGIIWNNWASNLRWSYKLMVAQWYCGPISEARKGIYKYGPFANQMDASAFLEEGDLLIAVDSNSKLVAFSFIFGSGFDHMFRNPYQLGNYWRATAHTIMEIEQLKGMDVVVDRNENPYAAAEKYRQMAQMHSNCMWASYLMDAATIIEKLADIVQNDVALNFPKTVPLPAQAPAQAPAPAPVIRRRINTAPAPAPSPQAQAPVRRRIASPSLF